MSERRRSDCSWHADFDARMEVLDAMYPDDPFYKDAWTLNGNRLTTWLEGENRGGLPRLGGRSTVYKIGTLDEVTGKLVGIEIVGEDRWKVVLELDDAEIDRIADQMAREIGVQRG